MEPVSTPPRRHGKQGSLDNPEVREDVPGHIIPILEREFDDFDNEAEKFLGGETPETEFIGFRLKQGVYGQRQADVQMIRVKLPFGGITPEQMESFADVVEKYAPLNKGHITTRQNIQLHHIPLRDAAKAIRELSDSGLSSREGCGNTVRNVTGDPWAGVCEGELFDPTPYVGAYVRYFVRHPPTQLLFIDDEQAGAPPAPATYASPNGDLTEYERWAAASVVSQRQAGFSTVQLKVVRGDLTPEQFRGLAEIMRKYSGGYARTTVHQNLVLRWVRDETTFE